MPQTIIDMLKKGKGANYADEFRRGNLISLPPDGSIVVTGDIHGHRRNFERVLTFADLPNNPKRHLVLQEIIHGGPQDTKGGCLSYKLLFDAVRYKLDFPSQVHIVTGNHDTAFINDSEIMKDGKEMHSAMCQALQREFHNAYPDIKTAIKELLLSQPLAVKCRNRIWISHSLPSDRFVDKFDPDILRSKITPDDCRRPGSAYLLTWGRRHSQASFDKMAKLFDVDFFVLGHQPQPKGWYQAAENALIIASDHNHGYLLSIDLAKNYTITELIESLVPLASIS